jgi:hypothetical protein
MLTNLCYTQLAVLLRNACQQNAGLYMAIGAGQDEWDLNPPTHQREIIALNSELVRKAVSFESMTFLDGNNQVIESESPRLRIQVDFLPDEGEGTVRECGLFIGADQHPDSGILLSYFMHPRIDKNSQMKLLRRIDLDFTPRSSGPGQVATRYLGNSKSREFHDLDNAQPGCRIDAIRFDRRIYFASTDQATALGYDYCAYCFGRELSQR